MTKQLPTCQFQFWGKTRPCSKHSNLSATGTVHFHYIICNGKSNVKWKAVRRTYLRDTILIFILIHDIIWSSKNFEFLTSSTWLTGCNSQDSFVGYVDLISFLYMAHRHDFPDAFRHSQGSFHMHRSGSPVVRASASDKWAR